MFTSLLYFQIKLCKFATSTLSRICTAYIPSLFNHEYLPQKCSNDIPCNFWLTSSYHYVMRHFVPLPSNHSKYAFSNTLVYLKDNSPICNSCCLDSPSSIFTLLGVSKPYCLEQYISSLCCRIILLNSDIFLFTYRFIMISHLYKS
jgi:hypothetical protein